MLRNLQISAQCILTPEPGEVMFVIHPILEMRKTETQRVQGTFPRSHLLTVTVTMGTHLGLPNRLLLNKVTDVGKKKPTCYCILLLLYSVYR